jgi:hypothetical protein
MAKARSTEVGAQSDSSQEYSPEMGLTVASQARPTPISPVEAGRIVEIEVPLTAQAPPTEFVFHVDCKLTPQQSTVARRIAQQLDFQNARLNNGQRIVNVHGALKWLLEQIADELA